MTTIQLGSAHNKFTNCRTLLGIKDSPLLQVATAPLLVTLKTPPQVSSELAIDIYQGEQRRVPQNLQLISHEGSYTILLGDHSLLLVTLVNQSTAHLKLDLRPVGLKIFDDYDGLHIGDNVLTHNAFTDCATAIALE